MVKCPICSQPLRTQMGSLVKCVRSHRFRVEWGKNTDLMLVLAVTPTEEVPYSEGDEFPISDGSTFE